MQYLYITVEIYLGFFLSRQMVFVGKITPELLGSIGFVCGRLNCDRQLG